MVGNSSIGFPLYLTLSLLKLYYFSIGGLLVQVKINWSSFDANYSPGLHFITICVNYNVPTKIKLKHWNVMPYYFTNFHVDIFNLRQST